MIPYTPPMNIKESLRNFGNAEITTTFLADGTLLFFGVENSGLYLIATVPGILGIISITLARGVEGLKTRKTVDKKLNSDIVPV